MSENEVVPSSGDSQAEYEDELPDVNKVFPRLREKDPHKLLGIGSEASYEEVQEARAFLVEEYKGNKASVEAIEIAHDKIITGSFKHRRQEGIQLVSKGKGGSRSCHRPPRRKTSRRAPSAASSTPGSPGRPCSRSPASSSP